MKHLPGRHVTHAELCQQNSEAEITVGAGPRGETFGSAFHRKDAKIEDLELFLRLLQTRYGNFPVLCDQEECLPDVPHSTAMPTEVTSNGTQPSEWLC